MVTAENVIRLGASGGNNLRYLGCRLRCEFPGQNVVRLRNIGLVGGEPHPRGSAPCEHNSLWVLSIVDVVRDVDRLYGRRHWLMSSLDELRVDPNHQGSVAVAIDRRRVLDNNFVGCVSPGAAALNGYVICVGVPRVLKRVKLDRQAIWYSRVANSSKAAAKGGGRSRLDHESKAITWGATNRGGMNLELEIGKESSVHQLLSLTGQARYIEPSRRGFGMGCSDTRVSIGETEYFRRVIGCHMCAAIHLQITGTRGEVREIPNLLRRSRCHTHRGHYTQ